MIYEGLEAEHDEINAAIKQLAQGLQESRDGCQSELAALDTTRTDLVTQRMLESDRERQERVQNRRNIADLVKENKQARAAAIQVSKC